MNELLSHPRRTIKSFLLNINEKRISSNSWGWFGNYALNNLPLIIEKAFNLTPSFIKNLPFGLNHISGFMYGLLIGANPFCEADQRINKNYTLFYNMFNGVCGMITCSLVPQIARSLVIPVLSFVLPVSCAFYAGWAATWLAKSLFDSKFMCGIEQWFERKLDLHFLKQGQATKSNFQAVSFENNDQAEIVTAPDTIERRLKQKHKVLWLWS